MKRLFLLLTCFILLTTYCYGLEIPAIKGSKGDKGDAPVLGVDYNVTNGTNGTTPILGVDYFNGTNGTVGVSISNAQVNSTGWLNVTLSNSTVFGPWNTTGLKGDTGNTGAGGTNGSNGLITYINYSTSQYSQPTLNFINSTNATFTIANETAANRINITVNSLSIKKGTACVKTPWVNNTTTTQAHGLGVIPAYLDCYYTMINLDAGWTAGTIIKANWVTDTGTSQGYMVSADATNVVIRTFTPPRICNNTNIAEANWAVANFNITCVPYGFQP